MMQKNIFIIMQHYLPYLNWIDTQEQHLLERIKAWASVNTFSFNVEGLSQCLTLLTHEFQVLKGTATILSLPPKKMHREDGSWSEQPLGKALILRKRPDAPMQILLGGHYDTVFAPTVPFQEIEVLPLGIWKGPGITDMKGGIAILLTAVEALERSPWAPTLGWEIILSPDEEIGSPGSVSLYEEAAKRHALGLLFEPSFPDGAFVSERKGSATYRVIVHGRAAHVGRDFAQGKSAVMALARFIQRLENLQNEKEVTVNVADLEGKGPVNIVPPLASCRVNLRSMHEALLQPEMLQQMASDIQSDGIRMDVIEETYRAPKPFDTQIKDLFHAYGQCATELNIPFSYRSTGGVCDGNILAGAGLPTLDTAGAVGGSLHTFDEYLIVSSLVERAKLAALFLFKLANGDLTIHPEVRHA